MGFCSVFKGFSVGHKRGFGWSGGEVVRGGGYQIPLPAQQFFLLFTCIFKDIYIFNDLYLFPSNMQKIASSRRSATH